MHNLAHLISQSVCLAPGNDGSSAGPSTPLAVDFVLRQERLDEDLPLLVEEINRRRDPSLPPVPLFKLNATNVRRSNTLQNLYSFAPEMPHSLGAAYTGANKECLQQIAHHYQRDFELLGYQLPGL